MVQNFLSEFIASSSQGSSMDPMSREYYWVVTHYNSANLHLTQSLSVWILFNNVHNKSWLPQFQPSFHPTQKSQDNFKIQMVKLLLPILGGLKHFSIHPYIWGPPENLDKLAFRFNKKKRHFQVCMLPSRHHRMLKMLKIKCLELCDVINKPIL